MDEPGMTPERPLPAVEEHTRPFWEAALQHRLLLARCDECSELSHPPELSCAACGSDRRSWVEASGRGDLWSWTVCHPPLLPWFAQHGTWLVGVVELEEGPRMIARIKNVAHEDLVIGMRMQVDFEDLDSGGEAAGDVALVAFRPA